MTYTVLQERGNSFNISKEQALLGLEEGLYSRLQLVNRDPNKKTTIDYFICEPYLKFQVFDTKVHHVGEFNSASKAIELAELSVLVDETE